MSSYVTVSIESASRSSPMTSSTSPCRSKLADLHNAGVLTDDEYQQKLLVVRRLANGDTRRTG